MTENYPPEKELHCELLKRSLQPELAVIQAMTLDRLRHFAIEQCVKVRLLEEDLAAHKAGIVIFERDQQELIRQFEELIKEHMKMRSRLDGARAVCHTFPNFGDWEVEA